MNFLAHAYLSFDHPKVLIGNFIGDFVRGSIKDQFERDIVIGIWLHREIDHFTDLHPTVKQAQKLLRPTYGRYAMVITDIYFDYFLSKNWEMYDKRPIKEFARKVYSTIEQHEIILPADFLYLFHFMKKEDWLVAYGTIEGIRASLTGVSKRTAFDSKMETAHIFLQENEERLQGYFNDFFPDLIQFSKKKLEELTLNYDSL